MFAYFLNKDKKRRKLSIKMNMEESNEVRVKNEPICDSLSVPETKKISRNET